VALRVEGVVVDAKDERHVRIVGDGRDNDRARARLDVQLRLRAPLVTAGPPARP
jgi:hypothetical protein